MIKAAETKLVEEVDKAVDPEIPTKRAKKPKFEEPGKPGNEGLSEEEAMAKIDEIVGRHVSQSAGIIMSNLQVICTELNKRFDAIEKQLLDLKQVGQVAAVEKKEAEIVQTLEDKGVKTMSYQEALNHVKELLAWYRLKKNNIAGTEPYLAFLNNVRSDCTKDARYPFTAILNNLQHSHLGVSVPDEFKAVLQNEKGITYHPEEDSFSI